ncbi:MAG: tryptophan synthase subunit alpha [Chloroflexi bacterium]|jgi:tryptophan synthase alpha subunit|nr:tryptophan synthase subunit alpha [Chloroflexota bacterium]|tara:strand:- start:265 stop:1080 length:816 start_codon:yes stop_codon:yes gene_type:complete
MVILKINSEKNKISTSIYNAKRQGRAALIPFVTIGYPDLKSTPDIVESVCAAGADVVELGIPFSDPLAEGPTIQKSSSISLKNGTTMDNCLEVIEKIRSRGVKVPLVCMGYYNPIYARGLDNFCLEAASVGVDGLIVADLPASESDPLLINATKNNISLIPLLALTSTDETINLACQKASGFVYCISVLGVTGTRKSVNVEVRKLVDKVRKSTNIPVAVGFGVSTQQHVEEIAKYADAAVFGAALIEQIGVDKIDLAPQRASDFVKTLGNL